MASSSQTKVEVPIAVNDERVITAESSAFV
ncbi:hypothetical protein A2U01_0102677, partial [Trifolium medium]|nr:hypothetical protein [Trifolium medium]